MDNHMISTVTYPEQVETSNWTKQIIFWYAYTPDQDNVNLPSEELQHFLGSTGADWTEQTQKNSGVLTKVKRTCKCNETWLTDYNNPL